MTDNRQPTPSAAVTEHRHASTAAHADALADAVAAQLRQALQTRPVATLAVSGGRSPVAFFQALSQQPLPWQRVVITLVDERCLPDGHAERNATLVTQHLLRGAAQDAKWIDWLAGVADPQQLDDDALLAWANRQAEALPWPLDVVVLGMGEDGHTASWFPDSPGLDVALHGLERLAITHPRHAPHRRLTLTRRAVAEARHRHLALAGPRKMDVYAQARRATTAALPVSLLLHDTRAPLSVWVAETQS